MALHFRPMPNLKRIRERPRWLVIFLVLASVNILVELLMQPYLVQSLLHHLPPSVTEQDKLVVAQSLERGSFARLAFLPIRLLIGWWSFALLLYYISSSLLSRQPLRFAHIFSLEVRAEAILLLAKGATLFRLMIDSSSLSSRSTVPLSCAEFFPVNDYSIFTFLNSLNFFTIAYLAILTIGISVLYAVSKAKALFFVCIAWGISILFNVSVVAVLRDQMFLLLN